MSTTLNRNAASPVIKALLDHAQNCMDTDARGRQWMQTVKAQAWRCIEGNESPLQAAEAIDYSIAMMGGELASNPGLLSVETAKQTAQAIFTILLACH